MWNRAGGVCGGDWDCVERVKECVEGVREYVERSGGCIEGCGGGSGCLAVPSADFVLSPSG